jgi:hypothetical protein
MKLLDPLAPQARLFTYKVAFDGGSAPNPFHGVCTLAICKPKIRSVAALGDLVVGLAPAPDESRIVYCMVVDHVLPWAAYIEACTRGGPSPAGIDARALPRKVPSGTADMGDCIWPHAGRFVEALDSSSGHGGPQDFHRDVETGHNVILSTRFWYFGKGNVHSIHLPDDLRSIIPGRGHRSNANQGSRAAFVEFFNDQLRQRKISAYGPHGTPHDAIGTQEELEGPTRARCRVQEREFDHYGEESA